MVTLHSLFFLLVRKLLLLWGKDAGVMRNAASTELHNAAVPVFLRKHRAILQQTLLPKVTDPGGSGPNLGK